MDTYNNPTKDLDDHDEINESLMKTFSTNNNEVLENEIQQATNNKGLSPRGIDLERLPLKSLLQLLMILQEDKIQDYSPLDLLNDNYNHLEC